MKINLGCGAVAPEGWINIDASPNAQLAKFPLLRKLIFNMGLMSKEQFEIKWSPKIRYHNLRRQLPFQDNSCEVVYSSHVLEHFSRREGIFFMEECFRVTKPGGICRFCVPDLEKLVNSYVDKTQEAGAEIEKRNQATEQFLLGFYDEVDHPRGRHRWLYDSASLGALFERVGFREVKTMGFCESSIPDVGLVETREGSLQVEGMKPI